MKWQNSVFEKIIAGTIFDKMHAHFTAIYKILVMTSRIFPSKTFGRLTFPIDDATDILLMHSGGSSGGSHARIALELFPGW